MNTGRSREAGQALLLVTLSLLVLTGAIGLSIDMGYLRYTKRRLQTAADSAAVAGASELKDGDYQAAAFLMAANTLVLALVGWLGFGQESVEARLWLAGLALVHAVVGVSTRIERRISPDFLPTGSGPDLVHHLALIEYIQEHWRLVHDVRLSEYLGEMVDYTPGLHLLVALAAAWIPGVDALPGRTFSGRVNTVSLEAEPGTGSRLQYPVVITIDNQDAKLRPSMTAHLRFGRRPQAQ